MANFKVDENLPDEVADRLRQAGHDATSVLGQRLGGHDDASVAAVCQTESRALITLDTDLAGIGTYRTALIISGSRGWSVYYSEHGPVFLRSQNVGHGQLDLSDVVHVRPPDTAEGTRTALRQRDIVVSITGDVGNVAAIDESILPAPPAHSRRSLLVSFAAGRWLHGTASATAGPCPTRTAPGPGLQAPGVVSPRPPWPLRRRELDRNHSQRLLYSRRALHRQAMGR